MASYDLDRTAIDSLLAAENSDPHVRKAIIDYLVGKGSSAADALQFVGGLNGDVPCAGPTDLWSTVAAAIGPTGDLQWGGIGKSNDIFGGSGNFDTLPGGSYDVHITGSGASVVGTSGNDTFLARTGSNDTIAGGAGYDQILFNTSSTNASVTTDQHGVTTITFSGGSLTVSNVEQLDFVDHTVKL
jgi:Ca2+-binding RTX toxin-like protein